MAVRQRFRYCSCAPAWAGSRRKINRQCVTCPRDLTTEEDVKLVFTVLAESVAARLRDYNLKCTGVEIQIRDNKLYYMTRQQEINRPTFLSRDILNAAMQLFKEHYRWYYDVRGVALRGINLVTADTLVELSLFEDERKNIAAEALARTVDILRSRFGHNSVLRASALLDRKLTGFSPKEDHTIHPVSYFR